MERTEIDAKELMRGSDVTVRESSDVKDEKLVGDIVMTEDCVEDVTGDMVDEVLGKALLDCVDDPRVL